MTSQDKARQLKESFNDALTTRDCAMVCVDEIINAYPHTYDIEKESTKAGEEVTIIMNIRSNIEYWQEVKAEIKNL